MVVWLVVTMVVVAFVISVGLVAADDFDGVVLVDVLDGVRLVGLLLWVELVAEGAGLLWVEAWVWVEIVAWVVSTVVWVELEDTELVVDVWPAVILKGTIIVYYKLLWDNTLAVPQTVYTFPSALPFILAAIKMWQHKTVCIVQFFFFFFYWIKFHIYIYIIMIILKHLVRFRCSLLKW